MEMNQTFWDIESFSTEASSNVLRDLTIMKLFTYSQWANIFVVSAEILLIGLRPDWQFIPRNNFILVAFNIGFVAHVVAGYLVVYMYGFIFYYYTLHGSVQLQLLTQCITEMDKDLSRSGLKSDGEAYQRNVHNWLLLIIKHHYGLVR